MVWQILFWGWVASEIVVGVATRTNRSSGIVRDRGSLLILWIVIVSSATACGVISAAAPATMFGGAHWLKTASVVVLVAALTIRWMAIVTLGKSFSSNVAIRESQQVHKTGLYRFVRHPSYLGLWMVLMAAGVHTRNWIGLAVAVVPITAALLYRIRVEEEALRAAFGEEYLEYCRTTKRLVPGVY
jgi:protein-S-isoprenylcysteine O-methyltransferase Ste14